MPYSDGRLWCSKCRPYVRFEPTHRRRLWPPKRLSGHLAYQDLLTGICPRCQALVFAWLGIDHSGQVENYYAIPFKRQDAWRVRMKRDAVRGPNAYGASSVRGSIREKNSGRFIFCESIPVR